MSWTCGHLRVKTLDVQGQEILTRDKVSLRVNLTATYRFADALKAVRAAKDPLDHLYKEIQFGLRGCGRHAHARRVAGGQVGDRPHCRRARRRTLR